MEVRQLTRALAGVRREKRGESGSVISGLSAVYYREGEPGTEFRLMSDVVERIRPGAFDRALKEAQDVRGLYNHDSAALLGRVSSGTCRLALNDRGLAYEIDVDEADPDHQRVCAKIDRGDVTGSSFAFLARAVSWQELRLDDDRWLYVRWLEDVDLYDVGPVTWPAYEATTAGRSAELAPLTPPRESRTDAILQILQERDQSLAIEWAEAIRVRLRSLEV